VPLIYNTYLQQIIGKSIFDQQLVILHRHSDTQGQTLLKR